MAPKAAMKRPAASASEEQPTKKLTKDVSQNRKPTKVVDPVAEKCGMVVEALEESSEVLPDSTRNMLCKGVADSLGVLRDQRHSFQQQAVIWVGETLTAIEGTIQKVIDEMQEKVDGADVEKTARDAAQVVAQVRLDGLKESESQLKEKLASNTSALQEATGALAEAEAAQKMGDAELDAAGAKKEKLEVTQNDTYRKLKEGSATGAAVKKLVATLLSVGKSLGFDTSLLDSLPAALAKAPDARGTFDGIVLTQFEESITKRIGELDELIANGAPAKEARAAAVQAAQAVKTTAEEQEQASVIALQEAQKAVKAGEAEVKTAKKAVGDLEPELKSAKVDHDVATAKLEAFREKPLAAFIELRDRSTPPPPIAEEPEEPVAAEKAAEEAHADKAHADKADADEGMPQAVTTEEKVPVAASEEAK